MKTSQAVIIHASDHHSSFKTREKYSNFHLNRYKDQRLNYFSSDLNLIRDTLRPLVQISLHRMSGAICNRNNRHKYGNDSDTYCKC